MPRPNTPPPAAPALVTPRATPSTHPAPAPQHLRDHPQIPQSLFVTIKPHNLDDDPLHPQQSNPYRCGPHPTHHSIQDPSRVQNPQEATCHSYKPSTQTHQDDRIAGNRHTIRDLVPAVELYSVEINTTAGAQTEA